MRTSAFARRSRRRRQMMTMRLISTPARERPQNLIANIYRYGKCAQRVYIFVCDANRLCRRPYVVIGIRFIATSRKKNCVR